MVCQACLANEATVHTTLIMGASATQHDFCESCYATADLGKAGWTSYELPANPVPNPDDITHVTDFFQAQDEIRGLAATGLPARHSRHSRNRLN